MRSLQRYKKRDRERNRHETHIEGNKNDSSETELSLNNELSQRTPNAEKQVDIEPNEPMTPNSKTKQMLSDAGLNKTQSVKIRKQL